MPPTRSRAAGLAVAATLALTTVLGGSVAAADSPEAAVNDLLDATVSGDFSAVDRLVCEAERAAVLAQLDPGEAMGLDVAGELISFRIDDRNVDVLSEEGDEATVRLTGAMSMDLGGEDLETIALTLLEADMGEMSEDDIDLMLPFLEMALTQTMDLDEEITVVREDGEWVVCGGLGEAPEEPDFGFEASVSEEGICALALPDELTAVSSLEYDSSNGFETFCNYSNSDFEQYHATYVEVAFDRDAESMAAAYGADVELTVGGQRAWMPSEDGFSRNVIVQAGPDQLIVTVTEPQAAPEGYDWRSEATVIAELLMERLSEMRVDLAPATPEPTPEPTPEVPLCEEAWMDELNEQTGLGFDFFDSYADSCQFSSMDMEPGFHQLYVFLFEGTLEDYGMWLPEEAEETTLAGQRALVGDSLYIVELPGGDRLAQFTAVLDGGDETLSVTEKDVVELLAERIVAADAP